MTQPQSDTITLKENHNALFERFAGEIEHHTTRLLMLAADAPSTLRAIHSLIATIAFSTLYLTTQEELNVLRDKLEIALAAASDTTNELEW